MTGSINRGKSDPSQSLQMMERPLLSPDELKSMPRGNFVVMKTGTNPMQTNLPLFLDWGITFEKEYAVEEQAFRRVYYADKQELEEAINMRYSVHNNSPWLDGTEKFRDGENKPELDELFELQKKELFEKRMKMSMLKKEAETKKIRND